MCFSASASFGTSIVIGAVGVITLKKIKKPEQIPFAAFPLMFAVQQVSEGMLWIGLSDPGHDAWKHFPVYIFLFFAQIIWPSWIPFSVLLLEKDRIRKRVLMVFLGMGLSISIYLLYCMIFYDVSAEIRSGHIHYNLNFPLAFAWIGSIVYFVPTVISLFVSSVKKMPALGLAILISFLGTQLFFEDYVISVWCFFAAILSVIVLWITVQFNNHRNAESLTN